MLLRLNTRDRCLSAVAFLFLSCHSAWCHADKPPIVLYDFDGSGNGVGESIIRDSSDTEAPLNLTIAKPNQIGRQTQGIQLRGKTLILSKPNPAKLSRTVMHSGELTIEVWLTPGNLSQAGPARIISFSTDTSNRNFTLGQEKDRYDVRLRTTKTDRNGLPSLASPAKSAKKSLTHVVFTRTRDGKTKLFLDGKVVAQSNASGTFKNWDKNARLSVGDEVTGGRGWTGRLHRVALYAKALSSREIGNRYRGGFDAELKSESSSPEKLAQAHFEHSVAPLLSKHCLECHDLASAKGDLVLDRKATAFADAIVPGDAENSPLWISIDDDSMPHNRSPLTRQEKELVKGWINDGAKWSLDWIDPADYIHDAAKSENYVRRLTIDEYIRSVRVAVDVDVSAEAPKILPPDLRADGFHNTAYNLTVDLGHVEAYNRLAKTIVSQIDSRAFAKRFWGNAKLTDNDMRGLIQKMGTWVLRGPLDDSEIDFFRGISTTVAASGGDYGDAVSATLQAMLQSPRFLYRVENQNDDGDSDFLDDYQFASRISYTLWGSPPDQPLMNSASDGELSDPAVVNSHIKRMLADPRAIVRSKDFAGQWLNLNHLNSLRPGADRFPDWDPALANEMQNETLAFFEHVVWEQKLAMANLLDAQVTFCSDDLAKHYGLSPENGTRTDNERLKRYDLTSVPERGGLLTHGSVLTIGGDDASMVTRGLFVLNELLRGVVNDPPPCVDTSPVPTKPGVTARTIAEARLKNEACGGCHARFEPLAFGLEKFDGLGSFHNQDEHNNGLREDGNLLVPGTAKAVEFENTEQLMKLLSTSDRVQETLVWKLAQFATGRPMTANDSNTIRAINTRSREKGGTYQAILTEIILSPLITPM